MVTKAAITGWGCFTPAKVLDNNDLARMVDTTDEWIRSRTGISERRIASAGETTGTMCTIAAQRALESARIPAADIDLIICATTTPDHLLPATACLIQQRLGACRAAAFDLNAACSGFLYALTVANSFILSGTYRRVLIVGGETLSRFTDWHDRNTCVLFGDGAGAVVVESTDQDAGVLSTVLSSKGDVDHLLYIKAGGSACPTSAETVAANDHVIRMRGNDIFKLAVRCMCQATVQALDRAGLTMDDIHIVIPHQANLRIIHATQEALGLPLEKVYVNIDRHGNTGAGSVPTALAEYLDTKTVCPGDNLLMVCFGGGLTWGATILRWGDVERMRNERLLSGSK
jgi:3-oxoacyl-[acyl-carrier-protein] synthase-3